VGYFTDSDNQSSVVPYSRFVVGTQILRVEMDSRSGERRETFSTLNDMSDEAVDRIQSIVHGFDQRVQAAPAGAWANQSPCDEWKARDVVVHVSNNLRRVTAAMGGATNPEVAADDDIQSAWALSRDSLLAALLTADMTANIAGPFGPMPAEQLVGRIIATDVLVHTWDLARAVGGDESLPLDQIEGAYSGLKPMDAMIRRPGVFGDKVEAASTDLQTEFLSFLGRKV
jgi:uncharacterized protein (TIGR03086 family)